MFTGAARLEHSSSRRGHDTGLSVQAGEVEDMSKAPAWTSDAWLVKKWEMPSAISCGVTGLGCPSGHACEQWLEVDLGELPPSVAGACVDMLRLSWRVACGSLLRSQGVLVSQLPNVNDREARRGLRGLYCCRNMLGQSVNRI